MVAFGEKLRKQREERGISLDALANSTKIAVRMLRALECEQFDQLPGGVFNKGFVRAYARQVGLNEDETVIHYLAALQASQLQAQNALPDFRVRPHQPSTFPSPVISPGAAEATSNPADNGTENNNGDSQHGIDVAITNQQDRREKDRRDADRRKLDRRNAQAADSSRRKEPRYQTANAFEEPAPAPLDTLQLAQPIPDQNPKQQRPRLAFTLAPPNFKSRLPKASHPTLDPSPSASWKEAGAIILLLFACLAVWMSHLRRNSAAVAQMPAIQIQSPPVASAAPTPVASKTSANVAPAASSKLPANSPAPLRKTGVIAAPKLPAAFTVLIRADQSTWVSVFADGKFITRENLIAPAYTSVHAHREVVVRAGTGIGISFLLNGKPIRPKAAGNQETVYVLTSDGLSPIPQSQVSATNP